MFPMTHILMAWSMSMSWLCILSSLRMLSHSTQSSRYDHMSERESMTDASAVGTNSRLHSLRIVAETSAMNASRSTDSSVNTRYL